MSRLPERLSGSFKYVSPPPPEGISDKPYGSSCRTGPVGPGGDGSMVGGGVGLSTVAAVAEGIGVSAVVGNGVGVTLDVAMGDVPGVVPGTSAQPTRNRIASG